MGEDGSAALVFHTSQCTLGVLIPPNRRNLWHAGICHSLGHRVAYLELQNSERGYSTNLENISKFVESLETTKPTSTDLLTPKMPNSVANYSRPAFLMQTKSKLKKIIKNIYYKTPLNLETKRMIFSVVQRLRNRFSSPTNNDGDDMLATFLKMMQMK